MKLMENLLLKIFQQGSTLQNHLISCIAYDKMTQQFHNLYS